MFKTPLRIMNDECIKETYYSKTRESWRNLRNDANQHPTNGKLVICKVASSRSEGRKQRNISLV